MLSLFFICACDQFEDFETEEDRQSADDVFLLYEDYISIVNRFKEEFVHDGFKNISNDAPNYISVIFLQNHLDGTKTDEVNGEAGKSRRFEFYFQSQNHVLAKMNFIYFPYNHEQQYVTT